jgi:hypothetical protein
MDCWTSSTWSLASYIPSREQREPNGSVYRRSLIEERTCEINRIQEVLEGANIK